jgi:hypothetical protein
MMLLGLVNDVLKCSELNFLPTFLVAKVTQIITCITMRINQEPVLKVNLRAGVRSGHATYTTFGNTWRVFLYNSFVADLARIPKAHRHINVSGDDVVVIMSSKYKQQFIESFNNIYSKPGQQWHGLGQVAKDARWSRVSFVYLSKIFYLLDDGKYVGSRLPDRMLLMSNYMSSKCRLKPE